MSEPKSLAYSSYSLQLCIFFLLLCCLLPLLIGIPFVSMTLSGQMVLRGVLQLPTALLAMREITLLLVILTFGHYAVKRGIDSATFVYVQLYFIGLLFFSIIALLTLEPLTVAAGIRQFIYFSLIPVSINLTQENLIKRKYITRVYLIMVIVQFVVSVFQAKYMQHFEGTTFFGARVVGGFNNPNTIGIFFSLGIFISLFLLNREKSGLVLFCICAVGILMSGSRVAMLAALLTTFLKVVSLPRPNRIRMYIFTAGLVFALFLPTIVNKLSGRTPPPLFQDDRFKIIYYVFNESSFWQFLFGSGVGLDSNLSLVIKNTYPSLFYTKFYLVTESMYTAVVHQLGLVGLVLYFIFFGYFALSSFRSFVLITFIMTISVSVVWVEMYPINLYAMIILGYLHGDSLKKTKSSGYQIER